MEILLKGMVTLYIKREKAKAKLTEIQYRTLTYRLVKML